MKEVTQKIMLSSGLALSHSYYVEDDFDTNKIPEGYQLSSEGKYDIENIEDNYIKFKRSWENCSVEVFGFDLKDYFNIIAYEPNFIGTWNEIMRYHKYNKEEPSIYYTKLLSIEELKFITKHIEAINYLIKKGGGYIFNGLYWSSSEKDENIAYAIHIGDNYNGKVEEVNKNNFCNSKKYYLGTKLY